MQPGKLCDARLILVTDPRPDLPARVAAAVRGGVDIVQLREKNRPADEVLSLAMELKEVCDQEGGIFTANDDVELARRVSAAGVHLGQEDISTAEAKATSGAADCYRRPLGGHGRRGARSRPGGR